nr:MAG TPA: hypothetical protein [Caudoviricetes sp.]
MENQQTRLRSIPSTDGIVSDIVRDYCTDRKSYWKEESGITR